VLARQADLLRDVGDHLRAEAGKVEVGDAAALRAAPEPVAAVAVREWLRGVQPEGHPPDAATVARVLEVARGTARATDVGGGWRVARTQGRLRLVAPAGAAEAVDR
jgi:hypothetical protein